MAKSATGFQGFMRDHAGEFSLFGNGVSLAGGALSALSQYEAGKAQKAAGLATAANIRKEAQGAYDSALADEYLQRMNQNADASTARAAQAASGFMSTGTGNINEMTLMKQYEHGIAQAATQRENQRRSALYQADLTEWQARQAARASKRGALGTILGSVAGTALSLTGFGMAAAPVVKAGMVLNR